LRRQPAVLLLVLLTFASLSLVCAHVEELSLPALPESADAQPIDYRSQVEPILEHRCIVCHGCYDAPCQLLLTSPEGLERGATKRRVYDSSRLEQAEPTRLSLDATTIAGWREREFFSVLDGSEAGDEGALLLGMLALGRSHPWNDGERIPDAIELDINRSLTCPTVAEFPRYARKQPLGGMPYGVAPLSDDELATLATWVADGAAVPDDPTLLPESAPPQVARWERFLNAESLKARITARYLYEHWAFAHFTLGGIPGGPFFEIVRSRTPPETPIDVIATRRPTDDPGVARFWYRFRPLDASIVHKTHIVYPLDDAKLRRLSELFLESEWSPTRLPGYDADVAANPFVSFDQIPARSRYQFLLDDAQYFVETFIRGPVCRGQVAVNVIEDHFFVAFLDPEHDLSVTLPEFLEQTKQLLSLPAEETRLFSLEGLWFEFNMEQRRYMDARKRAYADVDPEGLGPTLDFLWDGDGHNTNALLTVFRNFDNAAVVRGFVGGTPKTAWVLDYPLFERIYYNLVAGFDVFGNVRHQVSTRLYMDHLRMQGEDLFLAFLPAERRVAIRDSWYVGATKKKTYAEVDGLRNLDHGTQIRFESEDVKAELFEKIRVRNSHVAGPPDPLNSCATLPCDREGASPLERRVERELQRLAGVSAPWVAPLPEVILLRIPADGAPGDDVVYTLVHNRAHSNVAFMFGEDKRLVPADDTLSILPGYFGSYPNFAFEVPASEIEAFHGSLTALTDGAGLEALAARWGIRRASPRFWEFFDRVHEDFRKRQPTEFGIFDLNRYENL
jgi:hypothetical protein